MFRSKYETGLPRLYRRSIFFPLSPELNATRGAGGVEVWRAATLRYVRPPHDDPPAPCARACARDVISGKHSANGHVIRYRTANT